MAIRHGEHDAIDGIGNRADIRITETIHHFGIFRIDRSDSAWIAKISQVTDDPVAARLAIGQGISALRRADDCNGARVHEEREIASSVAVVRSEEHTSELQSLRHLVCRLLLEKKQRS